MTILQHLRQIRALRPAPVIPIHRDPFRAVTGNLIGPINKFGGTTSIIDEAIEPIATGAATLVTGYTQQVEPAGEAAEYGGTVAGHFKIAAELVSTIWYPAGLWHTSIIENANEFSTAQDYSERTNADYEP
jgi:hypothetical protein